MSSLEEDWEAFKQVMGPHVRALEARLPERLRANFWIIQCYRSIEEFELEYPTPEERRELLDELRGVMGSLEQMDAKLDTLLREDGAEDRARGMLRRRGPRGDEPQR